jgi:hypothetical protein
VLWTVTVLCAVGCTVASPSEDSGAPDATLDGGGTHPDAPTDAGRDSSTLSCDQPGELCCAGGACAVGLHCEGAVCELGESCGVVGGPCCVGEGSPCTGELSCIEGYCALCGTLDMPCCVEGASCQGDMVCNPFTERCGEDTTPCGGDGEVCCVDAPRCEPGLRCDDDGGALGGLCQRDCGGGGQACCPGSSACLPGLDCQHDESGALTCMVCGYLGQACCEQGVACASGLSCTSGQCT